MKILLICLTIIFIITITYLIVKYYKKWYHRNHFKMKLSKPCPYRKRDIIANSVFNKVKVKRITYTSDNYVELLVKIIK